MRDRILLTGGAGFIGSHLCEPLADRDHEVWVLDTLDDHPGTVRNGSNVERLASLPGVHVVGGDVRDNVLLGGLFSDVPFDAVIHLAGRPGIRASIDDPDTCYEINVRGTLRLLEAMERHGTDRLIMASTDHVYGTSESEKIASGFAAPEDIPATTPYGASKRAAELLIHVYHALYGLSAHCLRLGEVYGPRLRSDLSVHRLVRKLDSGEAIRLDGDPIAARKYVHVDDVVRAILLSLNALFESESPVYETIDIGGGDRVSRQALVDALSRHLGVDPVVDGPEGSTPADPSAGVDGEKAKQVLGFEPSVDLDEGLRRFVEWYRQAGVSDGDESPAHSPVGASPDLNGSTFRS